MNKVIDELKGKLDPLMNKRSLTAQDIKFLEETLYNKWYGIQVIAAKILSKHQIPEAHDLLKDWFLLHVDHFSMDHIAYYAFLPYLKVSDIPWLMDLYWKHRRSNKTLYGYEADYYIYRLLDEALGRFIGKEVDDAIEALLLAAESKDNMRHVRLLAARSTGRRIMLKRLLDNPNIPNKFEIKGWFG